VTPARKPLRRPRGATRAALGDPHPLRLGASLPIGLARDERKETPTALSKNRSSSAGEALEPLRARFERRLGRPAPLGLRLWDGSELRSADGEAPTLVVRSSRAVARVARQPNELGLARAWVSGELDVDGDLDMALAAAERFRGLRLTAGDKLAVLRAVLRLHALGVRAPSPPAVEARPRGRLHSLGRDRLVVRHHYDVSNDFYRLVLGPTMVYSCAYFVSPGDSLEEAQERKLDLICRKLRLEPGERLLDIGCGWGSLVLHAAELYDVRAVGVTLSEPQAELARARLREAGLADRCEIRVSDYREVDDGPYDKIASVGMYEHVGRERLREYARRVRALLRPGGLFLNHGIVRVAPGRANPKSLIGRYVFPDGELHHLPTVLEAIETVGLELRDTESLREHYPLTLRHWVRNLESAWNEAVTAVGPERARVWRLYMTGSARTFDRGDISVHQVLAAAPGAPHGLPLARGGFAERAGEHA
jgi:cyclopropane-fatty-acyl-phospholipid synthase